MNGTKVQERIVLPNFLRLKRRNPPLKRRKLQMKKIQTPPRLLKAASDHSLKRSVSRGYLPEPTTSSILNLILNLHDLFNRILLTRLRL